MVFLHMYKLLTTVSTAAVCVGGGEGGVNVRLMLDIMSSEKDPCQFLTSRNGISDVK